MSVWIADQPQFEFGFTGFKPAAGHDAVVGQITWTGQLQCERPRLQRQICGIGDG